MAGSSRLQDQALCALLLSAGDGRWETAVAEPLVADIAAVAVPTRAEEQSGEAEGGDQDDDDEDGGSDEDMHEKQIRGNLGDGWDVDDSMQQCAWCWYGPDHWGRQSASLGRGPSTHCRWCNAWCCCSGCEESHWAEVCEPRLEGPSLANPLHATVVPRLSVGNNEGEDAESNEDVGASSALQSDIFYGDGWHDAESDPDIEPAAERLLGDGSSDGEQSDDDSSDGYASNFGEGPFERLRGLPGSYVYLAGVEDDIFTHVLDAQRLQIVVDLPNATGVGARERYVVIATVREWRRMRL